MIKFLLTLLITLPLATQAQYNIKGVLLDQTKQPVKYAEVLLFSNDSTVVAQVLADEKGQFVVTAQQGDYILLIRSFSQVLFSKKINLNTDLDLKTITTNNTVKLDEVTVRAVKPLTERKIDRLIFNVENSVAASGGDALDALRAAPGVKVRGDEVSMVGKSSMAVMVNDRLIQLSGEDLITFLRTIKSDNISSVEVITNPPAKYQAEGNSGLINIKLKKVAPDSWNATIHSHYRQNTYSTVGAGGAFNYQQNKLSFFSSFNYLEGASGPLETNTIFYPSQEWNETNNQKNFVNLLGGRASLDYQVSKSLSMGVLYNGSYNNPANRDRYTTTLTNNVTQSIDSLIRTEANTQGNRKYNALNYHALYNVDSKGRKILFDIDYFNYDNNSDRRFTTRNFLDDGTLINRSTFIGNTVANRRVDNYSVSLEVNHPSKWADFSYGGRASFTKTNNDVQFYNQTSGVFVLDPTQSNQFEYLENTQALYFSASKSLSDKWETQIGLRVENTTTRGNSMTLNQVNTNAYTEFFPTAYVNYNASDDHVFSLNYGRRIKRPPFYHLNPFRWYANLYSFAEGNPFLLPSFTHNVEFAYTYQSNWISSIYYSNTASGFEQVTIINEAQQTQQITPLNFLDNYQFGLYEYISFAPFNWLRTDLNAEVYYSKATSQIPITLQSLEGWSGEFSISNDIQLNKNKTTLFNLSYTYATAGVDDLATNTAFSLLNVSLKILLLKKKLQINIQGNDILRTNRPRYVSFSNNLKNSYQNYYDNQSFRISISYSLGNRKLERNSTKTKNEEEKDRID